MTTATSSELERLLAAPSSVIFLGAGASWDSGLPLGDAAAATIIEEGFRRLGMENEFARLDRVSGDGTGSWPRFETTLDMLSTYLPAAPLEIVRAFPGIGLASTHQLLAALAEEPRLWLTTNFDDQIERALSAAGRPFEVISDRDRMAGISAHDLARRNLVLKLHGDHASLNRERDLGVTIDQILRAFPPAAAAGVSSAAADRPLLMIGYAARDPDLLDLVGQLVENAPLTVWIDLDDLTRAVELLLSRSTDTAVSLLGSPRALESALGRKAPAADTQAGEWQRRVRRWASGCSADVIGQALASICLARNDVSARRLVPRLHDAVESADPQHRLWILDRQGEALLRARQTPADELERLVLRLEALAARRENGPRLRAEALLSSSNLRWRTGGVEQAERSLEEAERLSQRAGSVELEIRALLQLGIVRVYRGSESFDRGLENLAEALRRARSAHLPVLESESAVRLAIAMMRNDQASDAERILLSAEEAVRSIGIPRRLFVWQVNLAEAQRIQRHFDEAVATNRAVIAAATPAEDHEVLMNAGNNLGICSLAMGEVLTADRSFAGSARIARIRQGGEALGNALYNRGWLRVTLAQWAEAKPFLRAASRSYSDYGSSERAGGTRALEAWCCFRLGDTVTAGSIVASLDRDGGAPGGGLFSGDYRLIKFALTRAGGDISGLAEHLDKDFAGAPEQRFYGLLWLLELADPTSRSAARIVERAASAARQADLKGYFSVLDDAIARLPIALDRVLRAEITRHSPGPLNDLVASLPSFEPA